jgi:energy-converting hydrogenase Eha subunit E
MHAPQTPPMPSGAEIRHARRSVAAVGDALLFLAWWIVGALIPVLLVLAFVLLVLMMG